jgi:aminoglycoside phosphotransferase (APT) family kinase protein
VTVNTELEVRLLDVLRAQTGRPDLSYYGDPVSLSGGFWAEIVAFSLADPPPGWPADLVARVMPDAWVARKETIVHAAVVAQGFPTPAVRACGGPEAGLGRAFMVMDRATGTPLLSGLDGAKAIASIVRLVRQLPDVLATTMARLHALDPEPVRARLAGVDGAPSTVTGLLGTLAGYAADFGRADLAQAGRWLVEHRYDPAPDVVCHGDLHPFNLLVSEGQVTLLDWSASLLAPRAHDVAFTAMMLSDPPLAAPAVLRPVVRSAGRLLARRFVRRYEKRAGVAIAAELIAWHRAVVCLRALTEVASWVHDDAVDEHAGHPWLALGPAMATWIGAVTGAPVSFPVG